MKEEIIKIYESNRNYYKKHFTKEHFEFLSETFNWTTDLKEQIYCLRFGITEQPKCGYSKCDKVANFKGMTEGYGAGGCCRKHGQFISNLEKYGYEMPFNNEDVLEKARTTILNEYGINNVATIKKFQIKKVRTKTSTTNKTRLTKRQQLDIKIAFRRLARIEAHIKRPRIERDEQLIRAKARATSLKRHGFENVMQDPEFLENHRTGYKHKEYIWKTGEVSKVQGFEPFVLEDYENNGYLYNDIKTNKADVPEIWYVGLDGQKHRYFPDFYIPKENLVIEVKSTWTVKLDIETNNLKYEAAKDAGYNFKLEVR